MVLREKPLCSTLCSTAATLQNAFSGRQGTKPAAASPKTLVIVAMAAGVTATPSTV
jgi:hypothetical protein